MIVFVLGERRRVRARNNAISTSPREQMQLRDGRRSFTSFDFI